MTLTQEQIKLLDDTYRNPALGLLTPPALNSYFKKNGHTGFTIKNIKEYLDSLETSQTSKLNYGNYSYVAEGALEQFQIDLVYLPDSWFNNNYKYLLTVVDVFSKKADIIPLKSRDAEVVAKAFELVLEHMGIPKTIYSDQGSEFKNKEFNKILEKHKIQIIFTLSHAVFIESFNRTIKRRLMQYRKLHDSKDWIQFLKPVLDNYNNTKHSSTGIAPNDVDKKNEIQIGMKLKERAKKSHYPDLSEGDDVRIPVIHKVAKEYKQNWSNEIYKVEKDYHNGVYKVNSELYPRKELQLIKGKVIKLPEKSKQEKEAIAKKDKLGKAANNPDVKKLMDKKQIDIQEIQALQSRKSTRGKTIDFRKLVGLK